MTKINILLQLIMNNCSETLSVNRINLLGHNHLSSSHLRTPPCCNRPVTHTGLFFIHEHEARLSLY